LVPPRPPVALPEVPPFELPPVGLEPPLDVAPVPASPPGSSSPRGDEKSVVSGLPQPKNKTNGKTSVLTRTMTLYLSLDGPT